MLSIESEILCQKLWAFLSDFVAFCSMSIHQIWSCHVTKVPNLGNFQFCHNSTFNIGKSHKMPGGEVLYFRRYQPKHPPPPRSAFRVKPLSYLGFGTPAVLPYQVQPFELFARPRSSSQARMPKMWISINWLKWSFAWVIISIIDKKIEFDSSSIFGDVMSQISPLRKGKSLQILIFTSGKWV